MSIEIINLDFSYGAKQVLHNINLCIAPNETLTILGPNGSGKTTLLNLIAGLPAPPPGSVLYDGKPHKSFKPQQMAQLVGLVPQTITPTFDYSVVDYVVTGCAPQIGTFKHPQKKHYMAAMQSIRDMGIEHLSGKSYAQISGGERQQVSIARVLAQRPAYILMDEPTSHLDYGNQVRVLNTVKRLAQGGFGVVLTTHNPDQALLIGGKAAIIDRQGRLISGDSSELVTETVLSELYGVQLCIKNLETAGRKVCFSPGLDGGHKCMYS
jgi:iron complex transport system ATP-binding protein